MHENWPLELMTWVDTSHIAHGADVKASTSQEQLPRISLASSFASYLEKAGRLVQFVRPTV